MSKIAHFWYGVFTVGLQPPCVDDTLFTELNRNYSGKVSLTDETGVKSERSKTAHLNIIVKIETKSIYLQNTLFIPLPGGILISRSKVNDLDYQFY